MAPGRSVPKNVRGLLRSHLVQFVCLTNELEEFYHVLKADTLPSEHLRELIARCNATGGGDSLPSLSVSGQFLSSFLVRNCDNWRGTSWKHDSGSTDPERSPKRNVQRAAAVISATGLNLERDEPSLASLHQQQLDEHIPRWLWDERMYPEAEIKTVVKAVQGHEDELGTFPVFTSTQKVVRIRKPRWRQLHPEWEHGLERIMDFLPGTLWIEPEMWMQPKGRKTDFHYDYDPVNLVFQAGSYM